MEEKGLKVVTQLSVPPSACIEKQEFDVLSSSYGMLGQTIALALHAQLGSEVWIAGSRANQHCCNDRNLFLSYEPLPLMIGTGNGATISPGRGSIKLSLLQSTGNYLSILLDDVRHTPGSMLNMISEDRLKQRGVYWRGEINTFVHLSSGREFAPVSKMNGLRVSSTQSSLPPSPSSLSRYPFLAPLSISTLFTGV